MDFKSHVVGEVLSTTVTKRALVQVALAIRISVKRGDRITSLNSPKSVGEFFLPKTLVGSCFENLSTTPDPRAESGQKIGHRIIFPCVLVVK